MRNPPYHQRLPGGPRARSAGAGASIVMLLAAACTTDDPDAVDAGLSEPSAGVPTTLPSIPPGEIPPPPPLIGALPAVALGDGGLVLYGGIDDSFYPVGGAVRYDFAAATWGGYPSHLWIP